MFLGMCLLFAHAMSGCNTTSSFYAIGKTKAMQLLKQSEKLQNIIRIFGEDYDSLEDLGAAGEQFMLAMYRAGVTCLDALRALYFKPPKYAFLLKGCPQHREHYSFLHYECTYRLTRGRILKLNCLRRDLDFKCLKG